MDENFLLQIKGQVYVWYTSLFIGLNITFIHVLSKLIYLVFELSKC